MQRLLAAKTDGKFLHPKTGAERFDQTVAGTWKGTSYSSDPRGKEWIRQKIYPVIQAENNAFAVLEEDECQKMLQTFAKYRDEMRENMLDNIRT